jgi:hypothetical protein
VGGKSPGVKICRDCTEKTFAAEYGVSLKFVPPDLSA